MLYLPTASDDIDIVATPLAFKAAFPRTTLPFRKATEPAGTVDPVAFTVAVRVSASPMANELGEAVRLVVVDNAFAVAVTLTPADLLPRECVSPAYSAVRLYVPEARVEREKVATPEALRSAVPSTVDPLRKLTLPPGLMPPAPLTVAVKVSSWPENTSAADATRLVDVN